MNMLRDTLHRDRRMDLEGNLVSLLESGAVADAVKRILADKSAFQLCLEASSIHENSFVKVPIEVGLPKHLRVRLHFWEGDETEQNIHDHRFDFASMVLTGSVSNSLWQESSTGTKFHGYKYYNADGVRSLEQQRNIRLSVNRTDKYERYETYFVQQDDLHTISHSQSSNTIILEDRSNLRSFANVYSSLRRTLGEAPHSKVTSTKLRNLLRNLEVTDVCCN